MIHNVDPIAHLPQETLALIFSNFSTEELAAATIVSPTWHHRITECDQLWQSFELYQENGAGWLVIPNIRKHVKSLYYHNSACKSIFGIISFIEYRVDHYIDPYDIKRAYHSQMDTSFINLRFLKVLPALIILETFPNLTHMELKHYSPIELFTNLSAIPITRPFQHRYLTILKLVSGDNNQHYETEHLLSILRLCPAVRYLCVSRCSPPILNRIIERYPNLKLVRINLDLPLFDRNFNGNFHRRFLITNTYSMKHDLLRHEQQQNIQSVAMQIMPEDFNRRGVIDYTEYDISTLIIPNAHSLQEFVYYVNIPKYRFDRLSDPIMNATQWNLILSTTFSNLQRLRCEIPVTKERQFATMLRRHCPNLMDCSIAYDHAPIPGFILDALSEKKALRRLVLTSELSFDDTAAFKRLLESNYSGKNGIQHIAFLHCLTKEISHGLLEILNTTEHSLRGVEINTSIIDWLGFKKVIRNADRMDSSIEWIIYNKAHYGEYTEIDESYTRNNSNQNTRMMLGGIVDNDKLEKLKLETLNAIIPNSGVWAIGALVRREKHQKFIRHLAVAGEFAEDVIFIFLKDELKLP
ncbi:hypothetical protein BDA99DRAFT_568480 [Phascolomyces articulosus]|uniref:F-box domain-containing protein n=1 Tax=Phascolomyces articulosus TaxID=60185 RepID=A0AAD5PIV3_9FUNG|nr:hypothetical protein BDA99DRAFT_568480 [Phascolomyces articulosus]